jgi:lactoylglutathione lyase
MAKTKFDHVHLISADPEKTADFYVKVFGAKKSPLTDMPGPGGRKTLDMDLGGVKVKVMSPRVKAIVPGPAAAMEHISVATDDIDAVVAAIKANGGKIVQELAVTADGGKFCFFIGPQGVLVELIQRPK